MHNQERAWHQFEQTGSIKDYLNYRSIAQQNQLSATTADTGKTQRKESTHGHCGSGGNHHP